MRRRRPAPAPHARHPDTGAPQSALCCAL